VIPCLQCYTQQQTLSGDYKSKVVASFIGRHAEFQVNRMTPTDDNNYIKQVYSVTKYM